SIAKKGRLTGLRRRCANSENEWVSPLPEIDSPRTASSKWRSFLSESRLRLFVRGVNADLGAAARRGASPGPAVGPHLPAPSSTAEELIAAIGLEARNAPSGRHLEPLQDFSRSGIDSPQIALVTFRGAVPELSVDPGDPSDEAVGLDRAKNRPCFGIHL